MTATATYTKKLTVPEVAAASRKLISAAIGIFQYLNIPEPKGGFEVDTLRNKSGDVTGIQIRKPGTSGNADTMRIMLKSGSQPERITYYNDVGGGQPIDPERGVAGNDPSQTHIPLSYRGPWKGLPKWWTGG